MDVRVETINEWKKKIEVTVPAEEVEPVFEQAYRDFAKNAKIEGFRKGKLPISMVKSRYGEAIRVDSIEKLIQTFFKKAVDQEDLPLVAPGTIMDVAAPGEFPFRFTAEVEVEPEVNLKDYKGLKLKQEVQKVTEDDVNHVLESIQHQRAELKDHEGPVEAGHVIQGDVQALDDTGIPIVGDKWENRMFELGTPPFGPLMEKQLLGAEVGQERPFSLPEQDPEGKSEKEHQYSITVNKIQKKILPELDDEFAKSMGDFENFDALQQRIQSNIEAERNQQEEKALRDQVVAEIVKRNPLELPPSMVENALAGLWEEQSKNPNNQMDEAQFKEMYKPMATSTLKWNMFWPEIAEKESLEVTEDEIQTEIDRAVSIDEKHEKKIRSFYKNEQNQRRMKLEMLENKVFDWIKENSKIKTVQAKKEKTAKSNSPIITS